MLLIDIVKQTIDTIYLISFPLSVLLLNLYGKELFCRLGLRRAVCKDFRTGRGEQAESSPRAVLRQKRFHLQVNNVFDDFLSLHRARWIENPLASMDHHDIFPYFHLQDLYAAICELSTHLSLKLPLALRSLACRDAYVSRA